MAPRASYRLGAGLGTAALALLASDQSRDPDRRLLATEGLLERDLEVVWQISAAVRPTLAAPAAAHELTEHLLENVGKAAGGEAKIARSAPTSVLEGGMTEPIIGGTLLIVFEDVVSFVEVLEFLLSALVAGIAIGVILHCELAIGPLEFVGARRFGDAEGLVKVLFRHDRQGFD